MARGRAGCARATPTLPCAYRLLEVLGSEASRAEALLAPPIRIEMGSRPSWGRQRMKMHTSYIPPLPGTASSGIGCSTPKADNRT